MIHREIKSGVREMLPDCKNPYGQSYTKVNSVVQWIKLYGAPTQEALL